MHYTKPEVYLIGEPIVNWSSLRRYLASRGAAEFWEGMVDNMDGAAAEDLVEIGGRLCYRSWKPGLNKNVTRVRTDRADYFENIMRSGHGSVLEHAVFNFVLANVSRVVTHELVRHRAGTAISQESMRFVRIDELPFSMPEWAKSDMELCGRANDILHDLEEFQEWMSGHFGLDEPGVSFHDKKVMTSFMRRFAPEGITTDIMWSANIRTLRHVIDIRTDPSAEEEIRLVFGEVAEKARGAAPLLFQDFEVEDGHWKPKYRKV